MVQAALRRFYYEDSEANGFETLIESHKMWPSMKKAMIALRSLTGTMTNRRFFYRVGKFASGSFLFYSFAIAPLLRDMVAARDQIQDFQNKLESWLAKKNKPRRYSVTSKGTLAYDRGAPYTPSGYNTCWQASYGGETCEKRVVLVGQTDLPFANKLLQALQFTVESLGAAGPATLAWEFVPFSFVFDWFVDTSSYLGYLDNALTGYRKKILACSESIKYGVQEETRWEPGFDAYDTPKLDRKTFSTSTVSYYHREPISADPLIGWSGRFGKKQLALSAALCYQIVANLKNVRKHF